MIDMFLLVMMCELARPELYFLDSFDVYDSYDKAYKFGCEFQRNCSDYPMISDFCIIDLNHYCKSDLPKPCQIAVDMFMHGLCPADVL